MKWIQMDLVFWQRNPVNWHAICKHACLLQNLNFLKKLLHRQSGLLLNLFLLHIWSFNRDNIVYLFKQHRSLSATWQLIIGETCSSSQQTSYCHTWVPIIMIPTIGGCANDTGPRRIPAATRLLPCRRGTPFAQREMKRCLAVTDA